MCRVFITSDLHMGHKNLILNYRKFKSVEEHDELIISNWNKMVQKRDLVYILGDLTMEKFDYEWLNHLNGRKVVVGGNHDRCGDLRKALISGYIEGICGAVDYKGFLMTHVPAHKRELIGRYRGNIHGHVHIDSIEDPLYFNACLDVNKYNPILFTDIEKIIKERKNGREIILQ